MRYYYGGPEGWNWYPVFGMIMMFLFIALVFLLVALIFRRPIRNLGSRDHESPLWGTNAFKILDERLARGEIDIEEYNQRKEAIKRHQQE